MEPVIRRVCWLPVMAVLSACSLLPQEKPLTPSPTATLTAAPPTGTLTPTRSPTATATQSKTRTITLTATVTLTPTVTPTGTVTPTATKTPLPTAAPDVPLRLGSVSLVIPGGLAASAELETTDRTEWPYVNPSMGPMPEHWVITLQGYALADASYAPEIIIFHTDEYADFSDMTKPIIDALKSYVSNPGSSLPRALMISEFAAQIFPLTASASQGVRYLSIFNGAGYMPITNLDLLYYYQGLTSDRQYFISAVLNVNAAVLADDISSPIPPGGVPFPDPIDDESWGQYLRQVAAKINSSPQSGFAPRLTALDSLIRSIRIS
jgi:hypothetical protein